VPQVLRWGFASFTRRGTTSTSTSSAKTTSITVDELQVAGRPAGLTKQTIFRSNEPYQVWHSRYTARLLLILIPSLPHVRAMDLFSQRLCLAFWLACSTNDNPRDRLLHTSASLPTSWLIKQDQTTLTTNKSTPPAILLYSLANGLACASLSSNSNLTNPALTGQCLFPPCPNHHPNPSGQLLFPAMPTHWNAQAWKPNRHLSTEKTIVETTTLPSDPKLLPSWLLQLASEATVSYGKCVCCCHGKLRGVTMTGRHHHHPSCLSVPGI